MSRRSLAAVLTAVCLALASLSGCTASRNPQWTPTPWATEILTSGALDKLRDKYGQEFELVTSLEEAYPAGIGRSAEPTLKARPVGDDSPLAQFDLRLSDWNANGTTYPPRVTDDYIGVLMAPAYQAWIEQRIAGQFDQFRVIVWLADIEKAVPADVTPEQFMYSPVGRDGRSAKSIGILIGAAVPEGTSSDDLWPIIPALKQAIGNPPAIYNTHLRLQGFTAGAEYQARVVNAETSESAQALADSHTFGDGGILVLTDWHS